MSLELRWTLVTAANAVEHRAARRRFRCTTSDSPSYAKEVEAFLTLKSLAADDRILLGQFGPDVAAMAWWTVGDGCISKLLAYGVHPAYRDDGRTSLDLLGFMTEDRFRVARQSLCPGFMVWCLVHPENEASIRSLERATFAEVPSDSPGFRRLELVRRLA